MKHIKRIFRIAVILLLVVACVLAYVRIEQQIYPCKYSDLVEKYSAENDLDRSFVYAVIKCESSFDPNAVSSIGAVGLMQITSDTFDWAVLRKGDAKKISHDKLYDPETNIKYGTYLLRLHLSEFDDEKTALAAYHAGRGKVNEWLKNPEYSSSGKTLDSIPYKDTAQYVERVIKVWEKYNKIYDFNS